MVNKEEDTCVSYEEGDPSPFHKLTHALPLPLAAYGTYGSCGCGRGYVRGARKMRVGEGSERDQRGDEGKQLLRGMQPW